MKIVPPCGPTNQPLLAIVGEAPGEHEERLGRPFVGPSGHLLDSMLQAAGLDRSECYITNVLKTRPPNNDFTIHYADKKRLTPLPTLITAHQELLHELHTVQPKLVVALGAEALFALSGHRKITDYRGTLVESHNLRILPSLHPAYLLRGNYAERAIVEADLRKAKRQALTPSKPRTCFITDPSFAECLHYLRQRPDRIAFDLETTKNLTRLFGFAWSETDAISIPLMRGNAHRWTADEEAEIWQAIAELMLDERVEKVAQNAMYDCTILAREAGIAVRNLASDTMLAQHLLYPELPKGLDFISSIYTDHPMYWGDGTGAAYNCMDCVVTWEADTKQRDELRERSMWEFFQRIPMPTLRALLYVQSRGVLIDTEARTKLGLETELEMETLLQRIAQLCGEPINPNSPKQVAQLLYTKYKLPPQTNPKTKRPTTDDDALRTLAKKNPQHAPVINDLLTYRQKRVLKSTFIDMELRDGRVYTSYNVAGAVTGRLSSGTTIDGLGGNLQNIPRGPFRRIFTCDPGKLLIKADLSQAEYRVLIWKARIDRVIRRWTTDPSFNIHRWNASENIYRVRPDEVTKEQYSNAKNGVYAANYNVGFLKVSRMYNMESREAKFILDRYHEAVPEVRDVFQREIREELERTRTITNPLGRERLFLGRLDDDTFRAAYSHYCQSTVGDLINLALVELHSLGIDVLLQVHDELVVQAPVESVAETVECVRRAMERPLKFEGVETPLVIPAEIKVGPNWYDTMELNKWLSQTMNSTNALTTTNV